MDEKKCGWMHRTKGGRDEEGRKEGRKDIKEGRKRAIERIRKEDSRFI
jgi:hypothetical protein